MLADGPRASRRDRADREQVGVGAARLRLPRRPRRSSAGSSLLRRPPRRCVGRGRDAEQVRRRRRRRAVQVRPPSVVWRTVPCVPTAQPDWALANESPVNWFPWGRGLCQRQVGRRRPLAGDAHGAGAAPADGACRPGASRSASVANRHEAPPSPDTSSMRPRYLPGPNGELRPSTVTRTLRPSLVHLGSSLVTAREEQPVLRVERQLLEEHAVACDAPATTIVGRLHAPPGPGRTGARGPRIPARRDIVPRRGATAA